MAMPVNIPGVYNHQLSSFKAGIQNFKEDKQEVQDKQELRTYT